MQLSSPLPKHETRPLEVLANNYFEVEAKIFPRNPFVWAFLNSYIFPLYFLLVYDWILYTPVGLLTDVLMNFVFS